MLKLLMATPMILSALVLIMLPWLATPWGEKAMQRLSAATKGWTSAYAGFVIIGAVILWWVSLAAAPQIFHAPNAWFYWIACGMAVYGAVFGAFLPFESHGPGDGLQRAFMIILPIVIGLIAAALVWFVDWAVSSFGG